LVPFDRSKGTAVTRQIQNLPTADLSQPVSYCEKCGKPLQVDVNILGRVRRVTAICACREAENQRRNALFEAKELRRRLDRFRGYSIMDDKSFFESTFENWRFRDDNRGLYDFGRRYCDCWDDVSAGNRGMLLFGIAGCGKTYLAFAIANELYKRGHTTMAISASRIMKIIQDSYSKYGEMGTVGEMEILNALKDVSLLILDDLGVENKTSWAYEKLYSIIDSRYQSRKPVIITTNLTIEGLKRNLAIVDKNGEIDESGRIYNRIAEMCALMEVKGASWRLQKGIENRMALNSLLRAE